jgi:hypothetical protein
LGDLANVTIGLPIKSRGYPDLAPDDSKADVDQSQSEQREAFERDLGSLSVLLLKSRLTRIDSQSRLSGASNRTIVRLRLLAYPVREQGMRQTRRCDILAQ